MSIDVGSHIPGIKYPARNTARGCESWRSVESYLYEILVDPQRRLCWRTCPPGPFCVLSLQLDGARLLRCVFCTFDVRTRMTERITHQRGMARWSRRRNVHLPILRRVWICETTRLGHISMQLILVLRCTLTLRWKVKVSIDGPCLPHGMSDS